MLTAPVFQGVFCPHCGAGQPCGYRKIEATGSKDSVEYGRTTTIKGPRKRARFMSCLQCGTWYEWDDGSYCPFCHCHSFPICTDSRKVKGVKPGAAYIVVLMQIENKKAETKELLLKMQDNLTIELSEQIKNNLSHISKLQSLLR
jgi:hypothetical protein